MKKTLLAGVAMVFSTMAFNAQAITITLVDSSAQGAGNTAGVNFAQGYAGNTPTGANFDSDPLVTPPPGNQGGIYQSPFNSNGLTESQTYFSVGAVAPNGDGATSPVVLTLAGPVDSFTLLWGSIDSYNTIEFLDGGGGTIDSFTGTDVVNATGLGGSAPNYEQVALLTFDIEQNDAQIAAIRFSSSQAAFEFALAPVDVPEPATLALLGAGLMGLGLAGRRRKAA